MKLVLFFPNNNERINVFFLTFGRIRGSYQSFKLLIIKEARQPGSCFIAAGYVLTGCPIILALSPIITYRVLIKYCVFFLKIL